MKIYNEKDDKERHFLLSKRNTSRDIFANPLILRSFTDEMSQHYPHR